jgi:hypothetical protein
MRPELNGHGRNGHNKPLAGSPLEPSGTGGAEAPKAEGRDTSSGRFTAGNRFGKGNPFARRMAALREAFLSAASKERMRRLAEQLFAAAAAGDVQASKLLLLFVVGRPAAAVNPDTLDLDEWRLCEQWPEGPWPFAWVNKVSFAEGVRILQAMSERGQQEIKRLDTDGANAKE